MPAANVKVPAADVETFTLENVINDLCAAEDVKEALEGETTMRDEVIEAFRRNVRLQLISAAWAVGINEAEGLLKKESKLSAPASDAGNVEEMAQNKLLTDENFLLKRRKLHGTKILQLLGTLSSSVDTSAAVEDLRRKMAISSSDVEAKVEADFWLW